MAPGVPSICPVLIGRRSEVGFLNRKVGEARDGLGATVIVSGDVGIGKTRLVLDSVSRAISSPHGAGRRPAVLMARCFEPDRLVPYAAVLDLLHTLFSARSTAPQACFTGKEAVELSALLPARPLQTGRAGKPRSAADVQPRLFFYNMLDFLECLSSEQPLIILVEDLHWSDDASLQFLHYLARRLGSAPTSMLLVLSYRSDHVHDALEHFLASLDRDRLASEIHLAPLSRDEVGEMAAALLGRQSATDEFIDTLYALTEGNPFFVEEVIGGIASAPPIPISSKAMEKPLEGADLHRFRIPRSIHEIVQERERRLTPSARKLLRLAAVVGRRFDFALLRKLSTVKGKLLLLIRELVDAKLVVEETAETFAFRHALTREAVLSTMLELEKQALHRAVALTIERNPGLWLETRLPELAHHYYLAGVWDKAREYSVQAAEEAGRLNAWHAAAEHITRAIEATRALGYEPAPDLLAMGRELSNAAGEADEKGNEETRRLAHAGTEPARHHREKHLRHELTAREREVAALVAGGNSNKAIASVLVVAERTVESHVSSILAKLGFNSRSQIAAWAVEKDILNHDQAKPDKKPSMERLRTR